MTAGIQQLDLCCFINSSKELNPGSPLLKHCVFIFFLKKRKTVMQSIFKQPFRLETNGHLINCISLVPIDLRSPS